MSFEITKPISVWNREVKADFRGLFKGLTKAAAHAFTQKWDDLGGDFGEIVTSLGLDRKPGEFAWLLIVRSIDRALHELAKEYFKSRGTTVPDTIDEIVGKIDLSVESVEVTLTPEFFDRPRDCPVPGLMEAPFAEWLELCGLPSAEAKSIARRVPSYFVLALNEEWQSRAEAYETVRDAIIGSPFTEQVRQELVAALQRLPRPPGGRTGVRRRVRSRPSLCAAARLVQGGARRGAREPGRGAVRH